MNLLSNQLLPVWNGSARELVSLPGLFEAWGAGNDLELIGLKAHQQPIVECALAQFAAHALEVAGTAAFNQSERQWHDALQALAETEGAPYFWEIVRDNLPEPAFCQPALTTGALLKKTSCDVLALDTLVTSKNHDVKLDGHTQPSPADWVYALLTLQTSGGYEGRFIYGVARMNKGHGTRVCFAAYTQFTQAGRWREDVSRLPASWKQLCEEGTLPFSLTGTRLLAAKAWDGTNQFTLNELHPGFVEVCRPLRMIRAADKLAVSYGGSAASRIAGLDTLNGNVGDPWTPLVYPEPAEPGQDTDAADVKALSPAGNGFDWGVFTDLVFEDNPQLKTTPFAKPPRKAVPVQYRFRALSRGQCTTSGYQDFQIVVPGKAAGKLSGAVRASDRTDLLKLKKEATTLAEQLQKKAELAYLRAQQDEDCKPELNDLRKKPLHQTNVQRLRRAGRQEVETSLLPWLFAAAEDDQDPLAALEQWVTGLAASYRSSLQTILAPTPGSNRMTTLRLAKAMRYLPTALKDLK